MQTNIAHFDNGLLPKCSLLEIDSLRKVESEIQKNLSPGFKVLSPLTKSQYHGQITGHRLNWIDIYGIQSSEELLAETLPLETFDIIIPLKGKVACSFKSYQQVIKKNTAFISEPDKRYQLLWGKNSSAVMLRIQKESLISQMKELECWPGPMAPKFEPEMKLSNSLSRSWLFALESILSDLESDASLIKRDLTSESWRDVFLTTLLRIQPHSCTDKLSNGRPDLPPIYVKRAIDYINRHLQEEITREQLVEISGASERTLQKWFNSHYGVSPMSYLRRARLIMAQQELRETSPNENTVAAIAAKWKFYDASRFTAAYKKEFGELPSSTLMR